MQTSCFISMPSLVQSLFGDVSQVPPPWSMAARMCVMSLIAGQHTTRLARLLFLDPLPEQRRRLSPEALQLGVFRRGLVQPFHRLVEPRPGLVLLAQLPMSHREEESLGGGV